MNVKYFTVLRAAVQYFPTEDKVLSFKTKFLRELKLS